MSRSLTHEQLDELRQGKGSFGSAIEALKQGYFIKRASDTQNRFIFIQDAPSFVKEKFENIDFECINSIFGSGITENGIVQKHRFSDSDILAEDWTTIE